MAAKWITSSVAVVIMLCFTSALVFSFITGENSALYYTAPFMAPLVGYAFGVQIIKRNGNGK